MPNYICSTCGTQFAATIEPPEHCPICEDPRQYVNPEGQTWTTLEDLRTTHSNAFRPQEPGLIGIGTEPTFAIGQRALLIQTPGGNILWDCISLVDKATVEAVQALGVSGPLLSPTLISIQRWWHGVALLGVCLSIYTQPIGSG